MLIHSARRPFTSIALCQALGQALKDDVPVCTLWAPWCLGRLKLGKSCARRAGLTAGSTGYEHGVSSAGLRGDSETLP